MPGAALSDNPTLRPVAKYPSSRLPASAQEPRKAHPRWKSTRKFSARIEPGTYRPRPQRRKINSAAA